MPARPSRTRSTRSVRSRPTGKRREQEVLDAALSVFHEHGYEGASIEDIADVLGILKGSLYYYITSKEDLLFRIVSEVHEDVQRLMEEAAQQRDLPPLERLAFYIRLQVEYNARNLVRISVYYREIRQLSEARLTEIRRRRRSQDQVVSAMIEEAKVRGEIDATVDPSLASQCVFGTIIWVYTWYSPKSGVSPQELAETCVRYALTGLTRMNEDGADAAAKRSVLPAA
jgi:TetR/AcrR family transcriptional regulator, cholesterol catabolism regulator